MAALARATACLPRSDSSIARRTPALRAVAARPAPSPRTRVVHVAAQATATATVDAKQLNKKFGQAGAVEVVEGCGGLPTVVLKSAAGATAEVTLFGGCVTSWKTAAGREVLYIRPDAVFDKSKPISGGIPHCFPQFGPGAIQLHGFARNVDWELAGAAGGAAPSAQLVLTDNAYTKAMWPHSFRATYTVTLDGEDLLTELEVANTGAAAFEFTASLHSYFGVTDVETAAVRGLQGLEYYDRVADAKHPTVHTELREAVTFRGPVDAVYRGSPGSVRLDAGAGDVTIDSTNWPDVVVWTPWTAMEACYQEFVCVENAQYRPIKVAPGQTWKASTTMSSVADPLLAFCADNPEADECRVYE